MPAGSRGNFLEFPWNIPSGGCSIKPANAVRYSCTLNEELKRTRPSRSGPNGTGVQCFSKPIAFVGSSHAFDTATKARAKRGSCVVNT